MKKWMSIVLVGVVQMIYLSGCASEEVKEVQAPKPMVVELSCTLTQLDGECVYFSNNLVSCSMGVCKDGDCNTGKGKKEFPGESLYEGTFKNGILNGEGVLTVCATTKFEGILKDGVPEEGTLTKPDGSIYIGSLKKDLYEGKGVLKTSSGDEYDGTWKSGKKNGKFSLILSGEKSSITYQDDEDVVEITKRKKEEAEEKKRIAKEEAEERRRIAREEAEERRREREERAEQMKTCLNLARMAGGDRQFVRQRTSCGDLQGF
jgi:hypothetical protein